MLSFEAHPILHPSNLIDWLVEMPYARKDHNDRARFYFVALTHGLEDALALCYIDDLVFVECSTHRNLLKHPWVSVLVRRIDGIWQHFGIACVGADHLPLFVFL